jgi:hypothetical protein
VIRTADDGAAASASLLPDLVVHWDDATLASPIRLAAPSITAPNVGLQFTGQRARRASISCVPGAAGHRPPAPVQAERLQHLFRSAAGWPD